MRNFKLAAKKKCVLCRQVLGVAEKIGTPFKFYMYSGTSSNYYTSSNPINACIISCDCIGVAGIQILFSSIALAAHPSQILSEFK